MLADTTLRRICDFRIAGLSLIIILSIIFLPRGLVGLVYDSFQWKARSRIEFRYGCIDLRKLHREGYSTATDEQGRLLVYFSFANTMMLEKNPPIPAWHLVKNDITVFKNELDWNYKGNTLKVRLRRLKEVQALLKNLIGQNNTWTVSYTHLTLPTKA